MTTVDKNQIKSDLLTHLRAGIDADAADASAQRTEARVDEDDTNRVDDVSREDQAGEVHGLVEKVEEREQDEAARVEAFDFGPAETVRPGAVVTLDGEHYVAGTWSSPFTSGGVEYSGLPTDAPVYAAVEGKRAGESVTFDGRTVSIDAVN